MQLEFNRLPVIYGATVEISLCEVHRNGVVFRSWHAITSLHNFHHLRGIQIQAQELRPQSYNDANSKFYQKQEQNQHEV